MKRKRKEEKLDQIKKKERKIEIKRGDALKSLTEKEKQQYGKYKQSFFTEDQIDYIFKLKDKNYKKFVAKLLKCYIIDFAIEAKKKKISCRDVVESRKDKLFLK